jgi:hypothetical protein
VVATRVICFNLQIPYLVLNRKVRLCLMTSRIKILILGKHMIRKHIAGLDPLSSNLNHSPDSQPSKRTLQNRKAQREFRERKASYVKSLEQRIRAYESNEVQGNVELQRAARRLKEDNDQLREQLRQTQERLAMHEGGNGAMAAMPPARTPGSRGRGGSNNAHQQPQPPPQALYNQPPGFGNDVTAYDMMGSNPSFPAAGNPQGYSQYFAQQVPSEVDCS